MRVAIFGGSFDPIHVGHLYIAEEVRLVFGYDRILFVPSNVPPHKMPSQKVPARDRLEMVRLAVESNPAFLVNAFEIESGGVSYTIDTLRHLLETEPIDGRPGLIIGDDLLPGFASWRSVDEIRSLVDVIVAKRHGSRVDSDLRSVENVFVPVSSSDIRERIASGRPFRYLVPESVYAYISDHKLYCG